MERVLQQVLAANQLHPVLLDVGASGEPHPIWRPIATQSVYVGFDADDRAIDPARYAGFYSGRIVPKSVSPDPAESLTFYLTASPFCSSTLPPDSDSLADYLFADLFAVERTVTAPATTLAAALGELGLDRVDWFKTDSQGTDLRLFRSLPDSIRNGVLALDIEPGLIDAYVGEDLWIDAHRELTGSGFWLSHLDVKGAVRMRRENLARLAQYTQGVMDRQVEVAVRPSPGWGESRYLRTIDWLLQTDADEQAFLLLWAFAGLDGQFAFALDVGVAFEKRFGPGEQAAQLQRAAARAIQRAYGTQRIQHFVRRVVGRVQRTLSGRSG
ncbi:MAG: hypothetical protein KJZ86_02615 [Caldilineaceae bacterium]|nr:hypothetical protein [Caldilineaceae bacterium]HRJ40478.1 hypothetical protein [Caldilineaceae bacterium]